MAAIDHFDEDIARAKAILAHADPLPSGTPAEKTLRDDLLRGAWMFAVGALDAYFCDLYTDLLASVLMSKERQPTIVLPGAFLRTEVPLEAVYADYAQRQNWRWRMMARRKMERENVLSIDTIKQLLNPFFRDGHKLFGDVIDAWIALTGATRWIFGMAPADYQNRMATAAAESDQKKREKAVKGLQNNAAGYLKRRYTALIQRRHDCIHNCDRPRNALKRVRSAASVKRVISDIEFLVRNVEAHVITEFRQFLLGLGCTAQTINQVGY
ncbi:MAG: hypothetical protein AB7L90_22850 [Hyphomicrobiaceae bacterium]